jgi:multidrug efflux pump subunit AcrB
VLLSLVIALTITPMLCSYFLTVRKMGRPCPGMRSGPLGPAVTWLVRIQWFFDRWIIEPILLRPMDWGMRQLARGYRVALEHALHHQWWVVPASLLLAATALLFAFGITVPLPRWLTVDSKQPGLAVGPKLDIQRTAKPEFVFKPIGQERLR